MSASDPPDAELLKKAVEGDAQAYGDLYERYLDPIYRYVYHRVGDELEAEDLTEMAFLKVWEALPQFDISRTPFSAWLYRVAHNLVVDHFRTRRVHEELPQELPWPGGQPEKAAMMGEQRRELLTAMSNLRSDYQEVLTLRFLSEMSHGETAKVIRRSVGAVRVLQHRALEALRQIMAQKEGWTP